MLVYNPKAKARKASRKTSKEKYCKINRMNLIFLKDSEKFI